MGSVPPGLGFRIGKCFGEGLGLHPVGRIRVPLGGWGTALQGEWWEGLHGGGGLGYSFLHCPPLPPGFRIHISAAAGLLLESRVGDWPGDTERGKGAGGGRVSNFMEAIV